MPNISRICIGLSRVCDRTVNGVLLPAGWMNATDALGVIQISAGATARTPTKSYSPWTCTQTSDLAVAWRLEKRPLDRLMAYNFSVSQLHMLSNQP